MHECPQCGEVCDCDLEDTWFNGYYEGCSHDCEDYDDDDPDINQCTRCELYFPEYDGEFVDGENGQQMFYCYHCAVALGIIADD